MCAYTWNRINPIITPISKIVSHADGIITVIRAQTYRDLHSPSWNFGWLHMSFKLYEEPKTTRQHPLILADALSLADCMYYQFLTSYLASNAEEAVRPT